jgi:hypothetical protein
VPYNGGHPWHPGHAWDLRTAQALLLGTGWIQEVDLSMAQREDMSKFTVWLWSRSPLAIPARKWLDVPEPDGDERLTTHRGVLAAGNKRALRYPICFVVKDAVLRDHGTSSGPPPPGSSFGGD